MEFKFKADKVKISRKGVQADKIRGKIKFPSWVELVVTGWVKFLSFLESF